MEYRDNTGLYRVKALYAGVNQSPGVQSIRAKLLRDSTSVLREPLVKLDRTCTTKLKDLDERVIPVEPAKPIGSTVALAKGMLARELYEDVNFLRDWQTLLVRTRYRSQGQTVPTVIVVIVTPPTGWLTLWSLSVVCSSRVLSTYMLHSREAQDGRQSGWCMRVPTPNSTLCKIARRERQTGEIEREWKPTDEVAAVHIKHVCCACLNG